MASSITSESKQPLDVTAVRERFPALASRAAYLDGPGGSQVPREVLDAVAGYLRDSNANLGGAFPTSASSDEVMASGRAAAADFTGGDGAGIAFGANMTTLNFQLAHAVARTSRPETRSWSRSSITTPTCRRGCWWRAITGWSCARRPSAWTTSRSTRMRSRR